MQKAVFFDIDGTLWDSKIGVPDSTKEAVKEMKDQGTYVILCSGRALACMKQPEILALDADGIIAGCGTYIAFRGTELLHKTILPQQIEKTWKLLKQNGLPVAFEGKNHYYIDPTDLEHTPFLRGIEKEVGAQLRGIDEEYLNWEASKFVAFVKDKAYQDIVDKLVDTYDISIHNGVMMEAVLKGYNKVSGIQTLCEVVGIHREHTYAFGDSVNDVGMLQYVACGVAMGSGVQEAKDAADYVTKGICEDGIYHACKHFSLI